MRVVGGRAGGRRHRPKGGAADTLTRACCGVSAFEVRCHLRYPEMTLARCGDDGRREYRYVARDVLSWFASTREGVTIDKLGRLPENLGGLMARINVGVESGRCVYACTRFSCDAHVGYACGWRCTHRQSAYVGRSVGHNDSGQCRMWSPRRDSCTIPHT